MGSHVPVDAVSRTVETGEGRKWGAEGTEAKHGKGEEVEVGEGSWKKSGEEGKGDSPRGQPDEAHERGGEVDNTSDGRIPRTNLPRTMRTNRTMRDP